MTLKGESGGVLLWTNYLEGRYRGCFRGGGGSRIEFFRFTRRSIEVNLWFECFGGAWGSQVEPENGGIIGPKVTELKVMSSNPGSGSLILARPKKHRPVPTWGNKWPGTFLRGGCNDPVRINGSCNLKEKQKNDPGYLSLSPWKICGRGRSTHGIFFRCDPTLRSMNLMLQAQKGAESEMQVVLPRTPLPPGKETRPGVSVD